MKIFLVDDQKYILVNLEQIIKINFPNFEIEKFISPKEALTRILNAPELVEQYGEKFRRPDVIFCDLLMPEMDGHEFLAHICLIDEYQPNTILVSGAPEKNNFDHEVHKPFSERKIVSILTHILKGGKRKVYDDIFDCYLDSKNIGGSEREFLYALLKAHEYNRVKNDGRIVIKDILRTTAVDYGYKSVENVRKKLSRFIKNNPSFFTDAPSKVSPKTFMNLLRNEYVVFLERMLQEIEECKIDYLFGD